VIKMSLWSLVHDLPASHARQLFPPIGNIADPSQIGVRIDASGPVKKLVITLDSPFQAIAMVPGLVHEADRGIWKLQTNFFNTLPSTEDLIWYDNHWRARGLVPYVITYENVEPIRPLDGAPVEAGDPIFNTRPRTNGTGGGELRISVEYASSSVDSPRGMHPVEFLSLLFWKEVGDPCINDAEAHYPDIADDSPLASDYTILERYDQALLQKLMDCREDGSPGTFKRDDWLGLKPPLRTYKRTEWEARHLHIFHNDACQTESSMAGVIRNPLVAAAAPGHSKCNIITAELAFRSGFRVGNELLNPTGTGARPLTYLRAGQLVYACNEPACNEIDVHSHHQGRTIQRGGQEYHLTLPFGKQQYIDTTRLDAETIRLQSLIQDGSVFYFARRTFTHSTGVSYRGHVFIISPDGLSLARSGIDGPRVRIDQHSTRTTFPQLCNLAWCHGSLPDGFSYVRLIPGGDPTEEWGILDLNCLTLP
jgi:hypothetical protein